MSAVTNHVDLAKSSSRLLAKLFKNSKIDFLYRSQNSSDWQLLVDGRARGLEQIRDFLGDRNQW